MASDDSPFGIIEPKSQFFHFAISGLGRLIRQRVKATYSRDEAWQARKIVETLGILDGAGVEGGFISQFVSQVAPYSDDPLHDQT